MQYAVHLQHGIVCFTWFTLQSLLYKSQETCRGGEDGLMERCYYWGTMCLNREYPVVRKCGAAAQINDFLCVFALARLCVCLTKYVTWESCSLNTCLQTKLCCFWIVCKFLLLKL